MQGSYESTMRKELRRKALRMSQHMFKVSRVCEVEQGKLREAQDAVRDQQCKILFRCEKYEAYRLLQERETIMAMTCIHGGKECDGCMACYKEPEEEEDEND